MESGNEARTAWEWSLGTRLGQLGSGDWNEARTVGEWSLGTRLGQLGSGVWERG